MLARQNCLRQICRVNAVRYAHTGRMRPAGAPSHTPERRTAATDTRTTVGTATVINVGDVPTVLPSKGKAEGMTREQVKNLTKEYKEYLQNPWKLSKAIERRLEKDRYEEALALVRMASSDGQVVVSWNILIDYFFRKQRLHGGMKLFNEMKKRGQLPNAMTFTTIFRGCARSPHAKTAVAEAVKVYMNMLTNTRVTTNIIHVNAVLEVCARALDIESMMSVAETVDNKTLKPDSVTYGTLLNGLRAWLDAEAARLPHGQKNGYTSEEHAQVVAKTLEQAKRIWQEVIQKWRSGALILDESLVFSMGRLLLLGNRAEVMSIFDLIEQTMRIPNLEKKDRKASGDGKTSATVFEHTPVEANRNAPMYPAPTTKTLAIVISALQDTRRVHLTLTYWNLLTRTHDVIPDGNNWHSLLYVLRRSHSSSQVVNVLNEMPRDTLNPKTFRIAFKTCLQDNVNPQVMQNADAILEKMTSALRVPDPEALRLYLDVATTSHHQYRLQKKRGADSAPLDAAYAEQIVSALDSLFKPGVFPRCRDELLGMLKAASPGAAGAKPGRGGRSRWATGSRDSDREKEHRALARSYASEVVAFLRKAVAAWDRVITERLLPEDRLVPLRHKRGAVNGFVSSYFTILKEADAWSTEEGPTKWAEPARETEGTATDGKKKRSNLGVKVIEDMFEVTRNLDVR